MNDTNQINPNGGLVGVWNLYGDTYAVNLGAGQVELYDPGFLLSLPFRQDQPRPRHRA